MHPLLSLSVAGLISISYATACLASPNELTLDQVSAEARQVFQRESGGKPLSRIHLIGSEPHVYYRASFTEGGKVFELTVSRNGKRIGRKEKLSPEQTDSPPRAPR